MTITVAVSRLSPGIVKLVEDWVPDPLAAKPKDFYIWAAGQIGAELVEVIFKNHSLSNKSWTSVYFNVTWSDKTRMTWAMVSYDLREAITVCNCDLCGGIYGNV